MRNTADSLRRIEENFNTRPADAEPFLMESTELNFKREAERIKQSIIQKWNICLRNRRIQFWNYLKNQKKSDIYLSWLETSPITLPRKLQFKEIPDEPEQQRRRREKLAMDQFQAEIDLLQMRGKANEEKYENTDLEMENLIREKSHGNVQKNLIELWKSDCTQQEEISKARWIKEEEWFEKYKTDFQNSNENTNPFFKQFKRTQGPPEANISQQGTGRNPQRPQGINRRPQGTNGRPQGPGRFNRIPQPRFVSPYTYDNQRPQIPFKEQYERTNFSNLQTYNRNQEALDNFRATQARFLGQRQPTIPFRS